MERSSGSLPVIFERPFMDLLLQGSAPRIPVIAGVVRPCFGSSGPLTKHHGTDKGMGFYYGAVFLKNGGITVDGLTRWARITVGWKVHKMFLRGEITKENPKP
jgi:hypothetical protein